VHDLLSARGRFESKCPLEAELGAVFLRSTQGSFESKRPLEAELGRAFYFRNYPL
jgi:hypothetical protein